MADDPADDPTRDRRPSDELGDRLSADDRRDAPRPPAFRDRMTPPATSQPPAFRGDAAFRDDRFEDPSDRARFGDDRSDRYDVDRRPSLEDELRDDERPLADPGTRLIAQFIDGFCVLGVLLPAGALALLGSLAGGDDAAGIAGGVGALIGIIALVVYQASLLGREGQTIGKRSQRIRIVDATDGSNPGIGRAFWTRSVANGMLGAIPYLGSLYSIADIVFIFRDDRRCIHDHLASTIVVSERG